MKFTLYTFLLYIVLIGSLKAQSGSDFIFHDTKLINGYTTNILAKRVLDVRIAHRFGDIDGGWESFFGLENASDISIGANYGLTDDIMVGINRTKGAGSLIRLINLEGKWRFTKNEGDRPSAFALAGMMSISTMDENELDPSAISYFDGMFNRRVIYFGSLIWDKKLSQRFSFQSNVSYVHRNYVQLGEENDIFFVGAGVRAQVTDVLALLVEGAYPVTGIDVDETNYKFPLAVAFEWTTGGGHIFQVSFTNSRGLAPTDYLVYSQADWGEGEFRLGFNISRLFRL